MIASGYTYAEAARLSEPMWEPVQIPYEGTTLPGYFYKVDASDRQRPTIVYHGGYNSSVEEMGYFFAAVANRHGYNCLTYDGPGPTAFTQFTCGGDHILSPWGTCRSGGMC